MIVLTVRGTGFFRLFAVLIGVGATTINAYLAEEAIADRHARGLDRKSVV